MLQKTRLYHIGISVLNKTTLVLRLKQKKSELHEDTWLYLGKLHTTKKQTIKEKYDILRTINENYGSTYKHIQVQ